MRVVRGPLENPAPDLPGANFADTCRVTIPGAHLDAPLVAQMMFGDAPPVWMSALMSLRDKLVSVFGLKPAGNKPFPILTSSPEEVILGMDDRHLDFRIVVAVTAVNAGERQVAVTTLVRTRNGLGRLYLIAVLPFHWVISRAMMFRLARAVS
ncbi:MAG: DUF2867 domain-containing protein [Rhodospirillaceae bacterium]|nr:DUF2867 domain-containing protein [Rhodospirillales bacterium]